MVILAGIFSLIQVDLPVPRGPNKRKLPVRGFIILLNLLRIIVFLINYIGNIDYASFITFDLDFLRISLFMENFKGCGETPPSRNAIYKLYETAFLREKITN